MHWYQLYQQNGRNAFTVKQKLKYRRSFSRASSHPNGNGTPQLQRVHTTSMLHQLLLSFSAQSVDGGYGEHNKYPTIQHLICHKKLAIAIPTIQNTWLPAKRNPPHGISSNVIFQRQNRSTYMHKPEEWNQLYISHPSVSSVICRPPTRKNHL